VFFISVVISSFNMSFIRLIILGILFAGKDVYIRTGILL